MIKGKFIDNLPQVYGNPWNHFCFSAGSRSSWSVITLLCQAPRQRDNSELKLLALFLQDHGVWPSLKHVPLTHSIPLKAFLGTSLMLMGTVVWRNSDKQSLYSQVHREMALTWQARDFRTLCPWMIENRSRVKSRSCLFIELLFDPCSACWGQQDAISVMARSHDESGL